VLECLTVTVLALSWCHMTIRVRFRTFLYSRSHGTVKTTQACTTGNISSLVTYQPKHVLTLLHCQEAEIISRTENVFSLRVVIFLEQTHVVRLYLIGIFFVYRTLEVSRPLITSGSRSQRTQERQEGKESPVSIRRCCSLMDL
jgi:hypothetical protein